MIGQGASRALADSRWHLLQDWISQVYAALGSDDRPTGLVVSLNSDSVLPAALMVNPDRADVHRLVFPNKHGNPVHVPDTPETLEAAGGAS